MINRDSNGSSLPQGLDMGLNQSEGRKNTPIISSSIQHLGSIVSKTIQSQRNSDSRQGQPASKRNSVDITQSLSPIKPKNKIKVNANGIPTAPPPPPVRGKIVRSDVPIQLERVKPEYLEEKMEAGSALTSSEKIICIVKEIGKKLFFVSVGAIAGGALTFAAISLSPALSMVVGSSSLLAIFIGAVIGAGVIDTAWTIHHLWQRMSSGASKKEVS